MGISEGPRSANRDTDSPGRTIMAQTDPTIAIVIVAKVIAAHRIWSRSGPAVALDTRTAVERALRVRRQGGHSHCFAAVHGAATELIVPTCIAAEVTDEMNLNEPVAGQTFHLRVQYVIYWNCRSTDLRYLDCSRDNPYCYGCGRTGMTLRICLIYGSDWRICDPIIQTRVI